MLRPLWGRSPEPDLPGVRAPRVVRTSHGADYGRATRSRTLDSRWAMTIDVRPFSGVAGPKDLGKVGVAVLATHNPDANSRPVGRRVGADRLEEDVLA